MMEFIVTISELQTRLEGSTALNLFLLHKLGGAVTIDKDELQRVTTEFNTLHFAAQDDSICIKLASAKSKETK